MKAIIVSKNRHSCVIRPFFIIESETFSYHFAEKKSSLMIVFCNCMLETYCLVVHPYLKFRSLFSCTDQVRIVVILHPVAAQDMYPIFFRNSSLYELCATTYWLFSIQNQLVILK
jgi:hypothetical protein